MILLLWSIPLVLVVVGLTRLGRGENVLRETERQFLFGNGTSHKEVRLSTWQGIKLALLSLLLFLAGVLQGLVVANFGFFWTMLVPAVTVVSLILLLALWLRSAPTDDSRAEDDDVYSESRETHAPAHRLDGFEL